MIGDTWNTLVAPPSERELDAALAGVRVRAMGHARRRTARTRVWSAVAYVLVGAAGVWVGRGSVPGLRLVEDEPDALSPAEQQAVFGIRAVPDTAAEAIAPTYRYHLTMWSEMDDLRWDESQAWIEGPAGLGFRVSKQGEQRLDAVVAMRAMGDSVQLKVRGTVERRLGYTAVGGRVSERRQVDRDMAFPRGHVAEMLPFGRGRAGEPLFRMRVEGPFASAPPLNDPRLRHSTPDTTLMWDRQPGHLNAMRRGARVIRTNPVSGLIEPLLMSPSQEVRVRLEGGATTGWTWVGGLDNATTRIAVPGIADTLRLVLLWDGDPAAACLRLVVMGPANAPARPALSGSGCFDNANPTAPLRLVLRGGLRLVVERRAP